MTIVNGPPETAELFDLCVVGSGPVAIALALECESQGLSVVVLESGPGSFDGRPCDASRATIADLRRHVPVEVAVCRALAGTSWTWGGRCVPFDDIDFEHRPHVPESGWPIAHADVKPWYGKAAYYLGCGVDEFFSPAPNWTGKLGKVSADRLERWSQKPQRAPVYREEIESRDRLTVCLHSTVTALDLGADGARVEGVVVAGSTNSVPVRARNYVLASGGLETTRLLLSTQRRWPKHFGGEDGALGRYYMGHLAGTIADIVLENGQEIDDFDFELDATGTYARRCFTIDEAEQRAAKLQNISLWPENRPFHDPDHRSGVKSLIFLVMAIAPIGRRLVSDPIRLVIIGEKPRRYHAHVYNVFRRPYRTLMDLRWVVHDRFVSKRWKPGWLFRTYNNKYVLYYRAEQRPTRESRVELASDKDAFGLERLFIDLRYSDEDAQSVVRAHDVLDKALRASGKGRLEYHYPQSELAARVLDEASDGYHQLGTTRMGTDPCTSVVGPDCQVHGLPNLFIASTSVFRTGGHANPTLLATALAARLAGHLATKAVNSAKHYCGQQA